MADLIDDHVSVGDEEDEESFAGEDGEEDGAPRKKSSRPNDDDSSEEEEDDDDEEEARKVSHLPCHTPVAQLQHGLQLSIADPRRIHCRRG